MKKLINILVFLAVGYASVTFARSLVDSFGGILAVEKTLVEIFRAVCVMAGAALLLGSVIKYRTHRQNPTEAPLSHVFALLATGLAVIGIAFIPMPV